MKLLTFNTHSLVEGCEAEQLRVLADAILREGFDVIALQEVNQPRNGEPISKDSWIKRGNFATSLASRLWCAGARYDLSYLPCKIGYGKYDEGLAFLCRTPIRELRRGFLTERRSYDDWKTRMALGVRCEGSDEWFFNLHFGWWDDEEEPFCAQWVRLQPLLPESAPYWLLGDFNNPAEVRREGYDLLRELGLFDAYALASVREGEGTASAGIDGWHGRCVPCVLLRIDQVWSSRPQAISSCRTLFDGVRYDKISDHFGVAVTVEK